MKNKIIIIISIVLLISAVCVFAVEKVLNNSPDSTVKTDNNEMLAYMGNIYRESMDKQNGNPKIVASYKGREIYDYEVEYVKKANLVRSDHEASKYSTDEKIVERIVAGIIMLDEAEAMGISVSDDEINQMIENAEAAYNTPDGKEMIDTFCESAGMTFEEYLVKLEEEVKETTIRQKLKDEIGKQYCEKNGIEFTKINPPAGMEEAIEKYINDLIDAKRDEIVFCN